jgi:nuclear pore complex protein Nup205
MSEDPLGGLEGLLRDLESLKENRLPNINRLSSELQSRVEEFRQLLDHKPRSNDSRKKLSDGKSSFHIVILQANRG